MAELHALHGHLPLSRLARIHERAVQPENIHPERVQPVCFHAGPRFDGPRNQTDFFLPTGEIPPVRNLVRLYRRAGYLRKRRSPSRPARELRAEFRLRLRPPGAGRETAFRRRPLPQRGRWQDDAEMADDLAMGQGRQGLGLRYRRRLVRQGRGSVLERETLPRRPSRRVYRRARRTPGTLLQRNRLQAELAVFPPAHRYGKI